MIYLFPSLSLALVLPSSQYFREMILNEIRKARELYSGAELAAELIRIQHRLDNVECLSVDIVINLLLTYRDIQVTAPQLLLAPRTMSEGHLRRCAGELRLRGEAFGLLLFRFPPRPPFVLRAAMACTVQILPRAQAALHLLNDSLEQQASRTC